MGSGVPCGETAGVVPVEAQAVPLQVRVHRHHIRERAKDLPEQGRGLGLGHLSNAAQVQVRRAEVPQEFVLRNLWPGLRRFSEKHNVSFDRRW